MVTKEIQVVEMVMAKCVADKFYDTYRLYNLSTKHIVEIRDVK